MKTKSRHLLEAGVLIICLAIVSGCATPPSSNPASQNGTEAPPGVPSDAFMACVNSCRHTLEAGDFAALDRSPCLLDPIPVQPDWVCDIAHSPRQDMDNNPDNQCQFYREGNATHFIELSPECGLIREV